MKLVWAAKDVLGFPPRSHKETLARLSRLAEREARYQKGQFVFPFGAIYYLDVLSLKFQYMDIFVSKNYDFDTEQERPTIIDCGGNIGLSVIWFKKRYPLSRIVVFEPDLLVSEVLKRNLAGLQLEDVQIVDAAAWIKEGPVNFADDGADSGCIDLNHGRQTVRAVRLSDFITESVDLLKLDIEGAEYDVIRDLCRSGKIMHVKRIVGEVHGRIGAKRALGDLINELVHEGFSFTLPTARAAPDLVGDPETTPFPGVRDGKFLMLLYAWRN